MEKQTKKLGSFVVLAVILIQTIFILNPIYVKATTGTTPFFTNYYPTIHEKVDSKGFKHPSVGLTKALLENVRAQVRAHAEPWNTYFNAMLESTVASKTVTSGNQSGSDSTKPESDSFSSQGFNGRFISDAVKAYTQALLYYITGDEVYRINAMHIIRIWSQMNPAKYTYFTDACIHTGIPLNRMVMAAEILRYTSCQTESLEWTNRDTEDFSTNLIIPVVETFLHNQNHFMNQHNYPLIGAISGYIFTGNRDRYNEAVEWYTVNRTAKDQGFNGSIKQLFRWIDEKAVIGNKVGEGTPVPGHVQHVEMGRDQAHGGGDLTNVAIINRLLLAQGTKVDPVTGTVSIEANAVGPYEFLNDRILAAGNYFWQYMLGYDTPWTPVAYSIAQDGTVRDTYNSLAFSYKGRFLTANFWDFYSYYTYVRHEDVSQLAPYYYEAFTKKLKPDGAGWTNVDAGIDFWLYLPAAAVVDASKFVPQNKSTSTLLELEDRYTKLDNNTTTLKEGKNSFIRFNAAEEGSKIVLLSFDYGTKIYGIRVRTNGTAILDISGDFLVLPDTKGKWKYVTATLNMSNFVHATVTGTAGVIVDIDHLYASGTKELSAPEFESGNSDLNLIAYVGQPVRLDFSATDFVNPAVLSYEASNIPTDATFDAKTGAFFWQPRVTNTRGMTVAVTDGTTYAAKNVNVLVTADRASAVKTVIESYNPDIVYTTTTIRNFKTVYDETIGKIGKATDEVFSKQLLDLIVATQNLELMTPLCKDDRSFDYTKAVVLSTCGKEIGNWVDGISSSFVGFYLAPNSYHILDFGPDYKVSATAFGFQSNIFADRTAGSVVLGSNDKENWTQLTTQETVFTQNFQTIQVEEAYKNAQYRYLKIEKIHRYPDIIDGHTSFLLELGEFRIYGQRHDK